MTVDELISEWTEEEREQHKDLIEECREREKDNLRARIESARGLMRIADNVIGQMAEEIMRITSQRIKGRA